MRSNRMLRAGKINNGHRKGTAPIELTLFLPTYAAMIMVLFTIFSFARTRGEVAVETRHEAWMKRAQPDTEKQSLEVSQADSDTVGRILNNEQEPTLGLVTTTGQKNATVYLKTLDLLTDIQLNHAVMTDTWDYNTIPFADQGNHRRLILADRTVVFGSVERAAFDSLASATAGFSGQAGTLLSSLNQGRTEAINQVSQARAKVSREISAAQSRIDRLNAELQQQLNMIPRDEVAISRLRQAIKETSNQLASLNRQLSQLNAAVGHLAGSLGASGSAGQ